MGRTLILNDEKLKRWTIGSLLFVALFAAAVSYAHIRSLAIRNGYDAYTSSVLPFAVDGLMVGASFMLVTAARKRLRAPLARCALWAGIAATLGANVAYGLPYGVVGSVVSAWPGASFILIVEAWMQIVKRQRKIAVKKSPTPVKKTSGIVTPNLTRSLDGLTEIPKVNGYFHVPGLKTIKAEVGCGQPRARKIQEVMRSEHITIAEAAERVPAGRPGRKAGTEIAVSN